MADRSDVMRAMTAATVIVSVLISVLVLMLIWPGPVAAALSEEKPRPDFEMVVELDELTSDHAVMFRLYWAFFLREPDGPGALYWIERQERCHDLGDIATEFADGAEFANRYGALNDRAFVEQIYRNVLGRRAEAAGLAYWTDLVVDGRLSRGEMVLNVSQSAEFRSKHRYPSDDVPGRGCRLAAGSNPTARTFHVVDGELLAVIDGGNRPDIAVTAPAPIVERAGFHQSLHPGAQAMTAAKIATNTPLSMMPSRSRDTHLRGAIDVVVHPLVPITAPVSGRVARAGDYVLYCKYRDGYVVINPFNRPEFEVKVLHIQDVMVKPGDQVRAGDVIAARATPFPFRSQIDALTAEPSWPHVHIETIDPSIPRKPSSGSC